MVIRIREYRESEGLTQSQLAEKLTTTQRNVSNWENGVSEPDYDTLVRLSDLFGISLDELFGREYAPADALAAQEKRLLRLYRRLTDAQRQLLLELVGTMAD